MKFSFEHTVDPANKLLICELSGVLNEVIDLEHLFKTIVKLAGKNQVKNVVLDSINFTILCANVDIAKMLMNMQEQDWLADLKIARVVDPQNNVQQVIAGFADKLGLPLKNFETRSQAMLWLLFNKTSSDR